MKHNHYLVILAFTLLFFVIPTEDAFAIKIKFKGSGGVTIVGGEISSICPFKSNDLCATIECKGFMGFIECLGLWVKFGTVEPVPQGGPGKGNGLQVLNNIVPGYLKVFDQNKVIGNMNIGISPSNGKLIAM